ncbi:unnamed protein product, partial [Prorocentrum cordatum]
ARARLSAEFQIPPEWRAAQPRVTAKSGWITCSAGPSTQRRAQLQVAACRLGLEILQGLPLPTEVVCAGASQAAAAAAVAAWGRPPGGLGGPGDDPRNGDPGPDDDAIDAGTDDVDDDSLPVDGGPGRDDGGPFDDRVLGGAAAAGARETRPAPPFKAAARSTC